MRAFPNVDDADQEEARLNSVAARQGQSTRYFVAILNQGTKLGGIVAMPLMERYLAPRPAGSWASC